MRKLKEDKKGFTLVELIIAMAILAILVGLLVPNVIRYIEKARESKDESALDTYYTAATTAITDEKAYDAIVGEMKDGTTSVEYTIADGSTLTAAPTAFQDEFNATVGGTVDLKSKKYDGKDTKIKLEYNESTKAITVTVTCDTYTIPKTN